MKLMVRSAAWVSKYVISIWKRKPADYILHKKEIVINVQGKAYFIVLIS